MFTLRSLIAFAVLVGGMLGSAPAHAETKGPVVFAAASLKNALDKVSAGYTDETGKAVVISYAASGALARQIEQGAPADIFFSADLKWMDHLASGGHIAEGTRTDLLGNELVLIAASDSTVAFEPIPGADLAGLIGEGRIAIGEPRSVPAGAYAKASLESLGLWAAVEGKAAYVDKVTAVLTLVARGEAPLGIVYATDARTEPDVRVVATFPASSHPPIVYPVAQTTAAADPAEAEAFLAFLEGPTATEVFTAAGFTLKP